MITIEHVYIFAGVVIAAFAVLSLRERRLVNAAFWGLLAASFLFGSQLSDFANGVLALALVTSGGFNLMKRSLPVETTQQERLSAALLHGNWLFAPALLIPAIALFGTMVLKNMTFNGLPLVDVKQVTLISLALGVVCALAICVAWLKPHILVPVREGLRLMDTIGWAAILPQLLASLGALFAIAGVGKAVGSVALQYLPLNNPQAAVVSYCVGMALFTAVMGNAFAAFPVMTAAIGLPLIVHKFGGSPVIMSAIGMLAGFCGTLTTPMAANFNIVPAALLELPDRNGVIKAQLPTAIMLLIANTALMEMLVYRY